VSVSLSLCMCVCVLLCKEVGEDVHMASGGVHSTTHGHSITIKLNEFNDFNESQRVERVCSGGGMDLGWEKRLVRRRHCLGDCKYHTVKFYTPTHSHTGFVRRRTLTLTRPTPCRCKLVNFYTPPHSHTALSADAPGRTETTHTHTTL